MYHNLVLDVGMGMLSAAIEYKLSEAGGIFVEVPTQKVKPSQTCPNCGNQKKKELSERIHNCPCGFTCDRDVAAAIVMLNWATGMGTILDKRRSDSSTSTHCGGFKPTVRYEASETSSIFLDGRGSSSSLLCARVCPQKYVYSTLNPLC